MKPLAVMVGFFLGGDVVGPNVCLWCAYGEPFNKKGDPDNLGIACKFSGGRGGNRTRTLFLATDFKSVVSADFTTRPERVP